MNLLNLVMFQLISFDRFYFAIKFFLINVMNLTEYENYTLSQYKFDEDFFNITYKHLDIESTEYDNEIIFFVSNS